MECVAVLSVSTQSGDFVTITDGPLERGHSNAGASFRVSAIDVPEAVAVAIAGAPVPHKAISTRSPLATLGFDPDAIASRFRVPFEVRVFTEELFCAIL